MKLLSLTAKNVFSLGEVEVNLADRGLLLVTGHSLDEGSSNGSGKSSIGNKVILWTLYGATAGGLKADDVVNRHGGTKTGWGAIDFIGVDGHTYTVKRSRPAKLELFKGDADISTRKSTETQKLIDQALGLDFKTFIQTYMFGQGRLNSYASLTPTDQKTVLEQILPIEQLNSWVEYSKGCLGELNKTDTVVTDLLKQHESKLTYITSHFNDMKTKSDWWVQTKEEKFRIALIKLSEHEGEIKEKHNKINEAIDMLNKLPDNCDEKLAVFDQAINDAVSIFDSIVTKIQSCQTVRSEWIASKVNHLNSIVVFNANICPTCGKDDVDTDIIEQFKVKNTQHEEAARLAELRIQQCAETMVNLEVKKDELRIKREELFKDRLSMNVLSQKKSRIEITITGWRELKDRTNELTEDAEEIASETNPFIDTMFEAQTQITELLRLITDCKNDKTRIQKEIDKVKWWLKVYSHDSKMKLFEAVCYFLDTQTNQYLTELKNPQLKVEFSTVKVLASGEAKEDFNVRVFSENGGEGFETLSGGEQQIVSFAISKALSDLAKSQTNGNSDFQILDEPFSMLDQRNCENLIEFLSKDEGTIVLISNDEQLMNLVPERLHVEKSKGVTRIVHG